MIARIHWRPTSDKGHYFESGTSINLNELTTAIGTRLNETHILRLRTMAFNTKIRLYDEVADTIERVGAIEIWGEY